MDHFKTIDGQVHCEGVPLSEVAERFGTPCYLYSRSTLRDHYRSLAEAFESADPLICYSVKANSNGAVLKTLVDEGAGFDVVSGGELHRVLAAGADPQTVVFAGVGKSEDEIRLALEHDILMFNVESRQELDAIERVGRALGRPARVALRINPDVDPHTHGHITTGKRGTKFGFDVDDALEIIRDPMRYAGYNLVGLHMHIGSQITRLEPYVEATGRLVELLGQCREHDHDMQYLNIGGGFGVHYEDAVAATARQLAGAILPVVARCSCRLVMEPGRFIAANAGVLLARVLYVKKAGGKRFVILDAAMTELVRPVLYGAYHFIWPVNWPKDMRYDLTDSFEPAEIVGGVCETGDVLASDRPLPEVHPGELVCIYSAGAYGFVMSGTYNSRPRVAEVMVERDRARLVRRRQSYDDLMTGEQPFDTAGGDR